jgi:exosortase D (VPLPA-CTERM-specific)
MNSETLPIGTGSSGRGGQPIAFAVACLSLVLLAVTFRHPVTVLLGYWARPQYSHGYVIPAVALLIGWRDLAEGRPLQAPSWQGIWIILLGFGLLALGELSTFNSASLYGLIVALTGLSMSMIGPAATRCLAPALIYLCFAVPPPDFLYTDVSARLQLTASSFAVEALDLMGFPVSQDGNVIDLGIYRLQVAEACSGLRYLFPLTSFSFLAAYMLRDRWWKRAALFVSAVPIAMALNIARIIIVGVTVEFWGIGMAEGFLHGFEGWAIFMACAMLLLAEIWLLRRVLPMPDSRFRLEYLSLAPPIGREVPRSLRPQAMAGTAIILAGALGFAVAPDLGPTLRQGIGDRLVASIPLVIGDWRGRPQVIEPDVLAALDLTQYFMADFRDPAAGSSVNLYVAYYATQTIGSAVHSPANCIPGGGWTIVERSLVTLPGAAGGMPVTANRLKIRRNNHDQLVYYWFNQRGRDLTEEWAVKWYLLTDKMATGFSDGYLLRLVTDLPDGHELEADARMQALLAAASPYLPVVSR